MESKIINPLRYDGWDDVLRQAGASCFFHSAGWANVLQDTYGYRPRYFSLFDENRLIALLPIMEINSRLTGRRGVSLPYSDYCEPVAADNHQLDGLLEQALEHGKRSGWQSFELRGGENVLPEKTPFSSFYVHTLSLEGDEKAIFENFRSSTKRNIKKSVKQGVTVEMCTSLKAVKAYCHLNNITKKRHGIPVQPFRFFKSIYRHVISQDQGVVALAYFDNQLIAGAMFFHFGSQAIYNYGASDKKHQHLRPNNLLMWEAIKWYAQKGCTSFSFGITDVDNDGLRQFKNGMASDEQRISYYKYDFHDHEFVRNDASTTYRRREVFKKMPISFLRLCGAALYKHYG